MKILQPLEPGKRVEGDHPTAVVLRFTKRNQHIMVMLSDTSAEVCWPEIDAFELNTGFSLTSEPRTVSDYNRSLPIQKSE